MMIIIIACAAGGVVLLAVIIAIIVSAVMYKRRKKAEKEAADAKHELAETLKRGQKRPSTMRRYRNTLTKTLSQAFSGFFRKKTVRGSHYGDGPEEGLPSAPVKRPRPDLLQSEVVGGTEEVTVVDDKQVIISTFTNPVKNMCSQL